jgi:hypothetical protein
MKGIGLVIVWGNLMIVIQYFYSFLLNIFILIYSWIDLYCLLSEWWLCSWEIWKKDL